MVDRQVAAEALSAPAEVGVEQFGQRLQAMPLEFAPRIVSSAQIDAQDRLDGRIRGRDPPVAVE